MSLCSILEKRRKLKTISEDQITLSWLAKHVPFKWFLSGLFLLSAAFTLGYAVKGELQVDSGTQITKDITKLTLQKTALESEIVSLEIELSVLRSNLEQQKKTIEQRKAELMTKAISKHGS